MNYLEGSGGHPIVFMSSINLEKNYLYYFKSETLGSPIKGPVKRKNTPSIKKIQFLIDIDGFLKSPGS
jgi:hypothetical protein